MNTFDAAPFCRRRATLLQQIGPDGIAVVFAATECRRSNDTEYPFRQDSYFHFLTGFPEPEAVLILDGRDGTSSLFCREKDATMEIWNGFRYGPEAAKEMFSFDHADTVGHWQETLAGKLPGHSSLFSLWGIYPQNDRTLAGLFAAAVQKDKRRLPGSDAAVPESMSELSLLLDPMRAVADEAAQTALRRACAISAAAHVRAMKTAKPGQYEYQVEAEILYEFMQNGARYPSYNSIVAGGKNACCLHYTENSAVLNSGELLLIDAGAEYELYAGDITRTFPVNGRFSAAQKDVYDIVLDTNLAAIAAIRPGANWEDISAAAVRRLTAGLIDLKLLSGSLDGNIESKAYRRFYMHGLGHRLGLDVHDVGARTDRVGNPVLLQPGMCTTVEPGLYITAADDIPKVFHNIGIRIEDDVLVTENGCDVLTDGVPKTTPEIEQIMEG